MFSKITINKKITINNRGFTLWEVLLILTILGCIAFIAVPGYSESTEHAKAEMHQANIIMIERAVALYYLDIGQYPENVDVLITKSEHMKNWRGPYLETTPVYPYDARIRYELKQGKVQLK